MAIINGTGIGETLSDTPGDDTINALAGDDIIIISQGGTDSVDGGADNDRLVLDARVLGGGINLAAPTSSVDGLSGNASWTNTAISFQHIENFTIYSSAGNFADNVTTGAGDDVFYHYGIDNTSYAADTIDLGAGTNDLLVADFSAVTTHNVIGYLNFTPGHNLLTVDNVTKIDFTNVERLHLIGSGLVDNVTGLSGDDILEGRAGNDTLDGAAGNDTLDGGTGDDILTGGIGNDNFIIVNGNDNAAGGADSDTLTINYGDATTAFSTNGGPTANVGTGGFDGQYVIDATRRVAYSSIEKFDITTGSGNDTITTSSGNDVIHAGNGDDLVNTGSGLDSADGGIGTDRISADMSAATAAVAWNLQANTYSGPAGTSFTNFEYFGTVKTGSGNDTIVTTDLQQDETIDAGGGNNAVTVRNGRDDVTAGSGTDTLIVDYGNATTAISSLGASPPAGPQPSANGFDGYFGDLTNRFVNYHGFDKFDVTTGTGNDTITMGIGNVVTNDIVHLGGGDDVVVLGRGVDTADGGTGTDGVEADMSQVATTIAIDLNANTYFGPAGTSITNFEYFSERDIGFATGTGDDTVVTRNAILDDSVRLGAGDDSVTVYGGNDFVVGYGLDTPAGQGGFDTLIVDYSAATTAVTRTAALQTNSGEGYDSVLSDGGSRQVTFYGFDSFDITTGSGNDNLNFSGINTAASQVFHTNGGNDTINLTQSTGSNFIDGGTGDDTMIGGMGDDTYVVDSIGDVIQDFFGGTDTIQTGLASYSLVALPDIETLTGTSNAGQTLRGNSGANTVIGADGGDFINLSDGGVDTALGGGGNDGFFFGATLTAADRVDGGTGTNDQIGLQGNYAGGNALVLGAATIANVELIALLHNMGGGGGFSYDITTNDANVAAGGVLAIQATTLQGGENFTFNGSAETDGSFTLYGGQGNDNMTGGAGNDGFYFGPGGFNGSDIVNGGAGTNDQLALDGDYTITLGGNVTNVEVLVLLHGPTATPNHFDVTASNAFVAAGQTMTVFGLQADTGFAFNGSAETDGAFRIYGGTGADTLTGGHGADRIFGGNGADGLTGGAGNDIFYYDDAAQSTAANGDIIFDFASGDRIDVSAMDAIAGTPGHDAFAFLGSGAFTNHAGELRAENTGGSTWLIQGDTNGDGVADLQLTLITSDAHPITSADFTFLAG